MSCAWRDRVILWDEDEEARQHAAGCEECGALAAALRNDLAEFRAAHLEPLDPAHFTAVRANVLEAVAARRRKWWRGVWVAAMAAASLLLAMWLRPAPEGRVYRAAIERPAASRLPAPPPAAVPPPVTPRVHAARRRTGTPAARQPMAATAPPGHPVLVKLLTPDPQVVIYWIIDQGEPL